MSNRVARTASWGSYLAVLLLGVLIICAAFYAAAMGAWERDPYGEVPALIDGETVCVPWSTQP